MGEKSTLSQAFPKAVAASSLAKDSSIRIFQQFSHFLLQPIHNRHIYSPRQLHRTTPTGIPLLYRCRPATKIPHQLKDSDDNFSLKPLPDNGDDECFDKIVKVKGPRCKTEVERRNGEVGSWV
ncbi:hypothetical protein LXL04_036434 [Taraxacum kok-saghyz]